MNAKAYLKQIRKYEILIENKMEMITRLREQAESITCPMGGERVKSSGKVDKLAEAVARIVDLETYVAQNVEDLAKIKKEIMHTIDEVNDADMINLLYKRYVHFETWDNITDEMGFAPQTIFRLHGKALLKVQGIIDKNESK